jgi:hypothetical protein
LKLLIDKETNNVIFAEAGKDFVDILFSFLTLPLGTIARLIESDCDIGPIQLGCLNTLYASVKALDVGSLTTNTIKQMIIPSKEETRSYHDDLKLYIHDNEPYKYFLCSKLEKESCSCFLSVSANHSCYTCRNPMNFPVAAKHLGKESVREGNTFIITADLAVYPLTTEYLTYLTSFVRETINVNAEKVSYL